MATKKLSTRNSDRQNGKANKKNPLVFDAVKRKLVKA
jgi:hypothetical protein